MTTQSDLLTQNMVAATSRFEATTPQDLPLDPTAWNPALFAQDAASLGVRIARMEEITTARDLAVKETGCELAPLWAMLRAHWHTRAAIWVHRSPTEAGAEGPINGVLMSLPLTAAGELALLGDRFSFSAPDPQHLCKPGEPISAMYMWLFAGNDGAGRRSVLRTALAWRDGSYADLRAYARAATPKGKAALAGLRFIQFFSDRPTLMFCDKRQGVE